MTIVLFLVLLALSVWSLFVGVIDVNLAACFPAIWNS